MMLIDDTQDNKPTDRKKREGLLIAREASNVLRRQQDWIKDAVMYARENGATWQEIADALSVTRQAAWEKYGRVTDAE